MVRVAAGWQGQYPSVTPIHAPAQLCGRDAACTPSMSGPEVWPFVYPLNRQCNSTHWVIARGVKSVPRQRDRKLSRWTCEESGRGQSWPQPDTCLFCWRTWADELPLTRCGGLRTTRAKCRLLYGVLCNWDPNQRRTCSAQLSPSRV